MLWIFMPWIFAGAAALTGLWFATPAVRSFGRLSWRPTTRNGDIAFQAQRRSSRG